MYRKKAEQRRVEYYDIEDSTSKKIYKGRVPDVVTAKKIAEAVWLPIYGKSIYEERPYTAKVKRNKIWVVEGNMLLFDAKYIYGIRISIVRMLGGTAYIEIRISDGKILKVTHGA